MKSTPSQVAEYLGISVDSLTCPDCGSTDNETNGCASPRAGLSLCCAECGAQWDPPAVCADCDRPAEYLGARRCEGCAEQHMGDR
jgi:hypothetical protein